MSIFKNWYGMGVHIPFADFYPTTVFTTLDSKLLIDDDDENIHRVMDLFTDNVHKDILAEWELFKSQNEFDYDVEHWFPIDS